MSQALILKAKGLITATNQLGSETPEGSLATAKNIVIDNDSVIESRRGFKRTTSTFASDSNRTDTLTSYQGKVIGRRLNDNKMYYDDGAVYQDYSGTYNHPDSDLARMKFAQMNNNLYFTTSSGVQMLDSYNSQIYSTGMPKGLDGSASLSGASGFMTNDAQVAYKVLFGTRDLNNNLYLGAPSQRIVIANSSGGTRDVSLTFTLPASISTTDFYQVYRSRMSGSAASEPNDELQLVYEANPTSGEVSSRSITIIDNTPDSLKGAFLYTNENQEGEAEANSIPPLAKDICFFKNFMFFSGIKNSHYATIKLLAVGGSSGLILNDTITIDSMVFTAKASSDVTNREFQLTTSGSASQNIDDTARALVQVINQNLTNTSIYAYYDSGYKDLAGAIFLQKRAVTDLGFTTIVSRITSWTLPASGLSLNDDYPHGLMWSKIQQPEHVPISHLEFVGSKAYPIRRIIALRDSLFILKDDGIWRLTGQNGEWRIDPLDTSTKILAPESAAVLSNQIYALTDQGIVAITDAGVQVLSRNIEDQLNALIGVNYSGLQKYTFGISYETDRKYILYTVSSSSDTFPTQAFVYNIFTNAWTTWNKPARTGFINSADNLLYLAKPDEKYLLKERKDFRYTDYCDEEINTDYLITSFNLKEVVLNSIDSINVGDLLFQDDEINSVITSIDVINRTITLSDEKTWSIGISKVFKAISCEVEWSNQHMGNAGVDKHFQEASLLFKKQSFIESTISFYTDISGGYSPSILRGSFGGAGWGLGAWGSGLWGGGSRSKPLRCFISRDKARGTLLAVKYNWNQAYSEVELQGISIEFKMVSERTNRA